MKHLCFRCNKTFTPRKTAYGKPEEVHQTLYKYGCKPVCYACYDKMNQKGFFGRVISAIKNIWDSSSVG